MTDLPTRVQILNEGAELTNGDRDAAYGPPVVNLTAAGALKDTFRRQMRRPMSFGELEAIDMVLSKLGRIATGQYRRDNYVDGATYFAIAGEIGLMAENQLDAERKEQQVSEQNGGKGLSAEEIAKRLGPVSEPETSGP